MPSVGVWDVVFVGVLLGVCTWSVWYIDHKVIPEVKRFLISIMKGVNKK